MSSLSKHTLTHPSGPHELELLLPISTSQGQQHSEQPWWSHRAPVSPAQRCHCHLGKVTQLRQASVSPENNPATS